MTDYQSQPPLPQPPQSQPTQPQTPQYPNAQQQTDAPQYASQYTAQPDAPQYDQQYAAPQYPTGTPYPPTPQYAPQAQAPIPASAQPYGVTSLGGWVGTIILSAIPLVGFILLICWAAGMGGEEHRDRRNWALAQLIIGVVAFLLVVIITAATGFSLTQMFDQY